jgi:hypothetical protein
MIRKQVLRYLITDYSYAKVLCGCILRLTKYGAAIGGKRKRLYRKLDYLKEKLCIDLE